MGTKKLGLWGGYPLKNLSVLAHLFTASGQFCYFSCFFFFLFFSPIFSSSLEFYGRTSPSLKILGGTHPPPPHPCFCRLSVEVRLHYSRPTYHLIINHVKACLASPPRCEYTCIITQSLISSPQIFL